MPDTHAARGVVRALYQAFGRQILRRSPRKNGSGFRRSGARLRTNRGSSVWRSRKCRESMTITRPTWRHRRRSLSTCTAIRSMTAGEWCRTPRAPFRSPGLLGAVMAFIPSELDADVLALDVRVEPVADPTISVTLQQWMEESCSFLREYDTETPGRRAVAAVVPAATMATHGTSFVHTLRALLVVRQM